MSWKNILGRLREDEGEALQELAAGKVVLEIGSLLGRSTCCLAEVASKVHAVDPHRVGNGDFHADFRGKDSLTELRQNIRAAGLESKIILHVGTVADLWLPAEPFVDFAFVDGDHSQAAVTTDLAFVRRVLKPDGTWAAHDYGGTKRGVTAAVDARVAADGGSVRVVGSLAIWQRG